MIPRQLAIHKMSKMNTMSVVASPIGNIRDIQYINIELIDYVLNQSWILPV